MQDVEAGFSAPGLTSLVDSDNYGGALTVPIGERFRFRGKFDKRTQDQGVDVDAQEYNLGYSFSRHWDVQAGMRVDERLDNSIIVPLTQEQGERKDAVVQVGYDSRASWNAYLFAQETLSTTGDRSDNSRAGVGGSFLINDKLRLEGEVSSGDLGAGGRIGSNYMHSEQTSVYVNYALENERTDNAMRSVRGREGNLVAGVKTRLGDSASVYLEERYRHTGSMTGLTHATGIDFAPGNSWNFGVKSDIGTLQDFQSGAETDRTALGVVVGYNTSAWQASSAVEYRNDDVAQPDLSSIERKTWLFRNSFKYQLNPSGRLIGKLNHSESESSQGAFYDGGFTEAVFGMAYRPVDNDRLNAMAKYTYFYNLPTTGQLGAQPASAQFVQKSHIAAFDLSYDVTRSITIGGKYAYRLGQVSLDREDPQFFDNNASLYVVRGDYRFRDNWEFLLEGRLLQMSDIDERRVGALTAVSRYFGDHFKVGLGYNFTDFSDDLTDLDYDHSGVFLNLTGSL